MKALFCRECSTEDGEIIAIQFNAEVDLDSMEAKIYDCCSSEDEYYEKCRASKDSQWTLKTTYFKVGNKKYSAYPGLEWGEFRSNYIEDSNFEDIYGNGVIDYDPWK